MNKKGYRYYLVIFITSTVALAAYVLYIAYREDGISGDAIVSLIPVPFVFTGFLFVFDKLFQKILPTPETEKKDQELEKYLKAINKQVGEIEEFEIEDYRRLQENEKFQKAIFQSYVIFKHGETEEINFVFLEKKFKKNSREYIAITKVINETKKMMENS